MTAGQFANGAGTRNAGRTAVPPSWKWQVWYRCQCRLQKGQSAVNEKCRAF